MHQLLGGSTIMNKCISSKHGLWNMDLDLHTGVPIASKEVCKQKNLLPPSLWIPKVTGGPFILLCPCPRCITPSARVLGLPIAPQGFLWKCILHRRSSHRLFPRWLFFLIAFLAAGSIPITVRATGTETRDLLWLQVGTKDKLLLGICFSYGLTKFSLATHGGKAWDLITSALG